MPPRIGMRRAASACIKILSIALLVIGPSAYAALRVATAPTTSAARAAVRAPAARRQAESSAKQTALERDRALQAKNAVDADRARAIHIQLNDLAARMDTGNVGRKRRAKLQKQCAALSAELEAVDPRVVTVSPRVLDENEPNDDVRTATAIDTPTDQTIVAAGSITNPGDVDVYTFEVPENARVWAFLDASASSVAAGATHDGALRLLDRDGINVLGESDDGASGSNFGLKVQTVLASAISGAAVPESGHVFLEVRAFDPSATMDAYKLILVVSTAQPQVETAGNDTVDRATPLLRSGATDGMATAAIDAPGDVDVYAIEAVAGRPLFVATQGDPDHAGVPTNTTVELLERDGSRALVRTDSSSDGAFAIMPPSTGLFFLRVSGATSSTVGSYSLLAALGAAPAGNVPIPVGPFCGDTATSVTLQNGSLAQDGIVPTCSMTKTCPGASGPDVNYLAFPFTNTTGSDVCLTLSVSSTCTGNSRAVMAAYLGSFDPNNLCTNYLGDPGSQIGSGTSAVMSVFIPNGSAYVITINSARPGNDCGLFCFTQSAVACNVTCPDPITVGTGVGSGQCGANVPFSVTAPCSPTGPTCTANGNAVTSGSFFPVGTTTVTCSAGGSMCSFTITVNDDTGPSVTCPAPTSASADASCQAAVPNVLAGLVTSDNCTPGGSLITSQSPTAGTLVGVGTTTVTVTVTDAAQNTSMCTTTFTVNDTTNPSVTCPSNIVTSAPPGSCTATVNYTTPTGTDSCSTATVTCVPASGSSFSVGTTTVTCTATDASNNQATCTFTVTLNDSTAPSVTCPATVNVNAPANACSATATFTTPTASDNCGSATVSCVPASGTSFPVGTTDVTCTATDTSGNTGSCTFQVIVHDVTSPTAACPANVNVNAPAGACSVTATYVTPTATDNCSGVTVMCSPSSGSTFPVGTTTVTCTETDASGNQNSCSFTVTVHDTTAPQVTCPQNIVVQPPVGVCTPVVNYATPQGSDACSAVSVVCAPASGSSFPLGVTTVTCTATDGSSNTASCSFTVTVSGPPFTITCPGNMRFAGGVPDAGTCGLGETVNYDAPLITSSACNGNVTVSCSPASGSVFPLGTTTVTCVATDQLQQTVSCSFTVTVDGSGAFGACYVDDLTQDTFREVIDPTSPSYGYWEYQVHATGEIICGMAEFVSYIPGRTFISYDNDATNVWMDANVNLGSGSAVIYVRTFSPYRQFVLRDRNINNDPPCQ